MTTGYHLRPYSFASPGFPGFAFEHWVPKNPDTPVFYSKSQCLSMIFAYFFVIFFIVATNLFIFCHFTLVMPFLSH